MYYTYVHRRASDNLIFYVGKGQKRRAWEKRGRNKHWVRTAKKHGVIVEIWNRFENEQDAFDNEKTIISVLKGFMPLTNKTDGGDGVVGLTKEKSFWFGKTFSKTTKAKMSAAQDGIKNSRATAVLITWNDDSTIRFNLIGDAAKMLKTQRSHVGCWISGKRKIPLKYGIKSIQKC
jgi:hypothetical protein